MSTKPADKMEFSPVFIHARREAIIIFLVWLVCLMWAVPYCYVNGYVADVDPETFPLVLGMPSWVFWGILVPWLVADVFTVWFCFFYMVDDDLGEAAEDPAAEAAAAAAAKEATS